MNLTNPKVSIFFLAFLPQFASPARGSIGVQMLMLGGLFMLATLVVFSAVAVFSGAVGEQLQRSPRIRLWLDRIAGAIFVGLAEKIALIIFPCLFSVAALITPTPPWEWPETPMLSRST